MLRIEKLLMDSGYLPGVVEAVKHKVGGTAMVLSKGVGITAGRKSMSAYRRKPGETHGHGRNVREWRLKPPARIFHHVPRELPYEIQSIAITTVSFRGETNTL